SPPAAMGGQTLGQQAADLEGLNEQTAAAQARVTTLDQQIASDQAREAPLEAQLRAVARVEYQRPAMNLNTVLQAQDLDQLLSALAESRLVTEKRQALVEETRRAQQEHVSSRQAESQQLARLQTLRASASSAAARLQATMASGGSGQAGPAGAVDAATLGPAACPVSGAQETQPFGPSSFEGFHTGIDLAVPTGTPIYAAASGVVGTDLAGSGYGNNVEIQVSDHRMDIYGHMTQFLVMSGQVVQTGQLIGLVGSTGFSSGPHVHYEIRYDGRPVDPAPVLKC
ncbi:MAG: peptidoglycan DD-metalloendopeptidase family protein, partial [Candidatus Dormibacteraeota bacterium]|nr:peptidoglycan DD-metalloendopeptidase family protein [Candidatus Dormibacteraeota bacterium]MBO0761248.1 peptidoglycan DD-metalloendopeptidase family protein [Candidatus Dormibacteraeota bacterium]